MVGCSSLAWQRRAADLDIPGGACEEPKVGLVRLAAVDASSSSRGSKPDVLAKSMAQRILIGLLKGNARALLRKVQAAEASLASRDPWRVSHEVEERQVSSVFPLGLPWTLVGRLLRLRLVLE